MDTFSRRRFVFAAVACATLAATRPAWAATPLSADDRAFVQRIEAYLNSLTTLKSKFLQVSSTGELARGTFYLRRPGRLRIEYAPPSPVLIVGDGHRLTYYDKELETANVAPIDDTLAGFLARERISFSDDVEVTGLARDKGAARVTLARKGEPGAGSLTLVFDDDPLRLRMWSVTDPHGTVTRVSLVDPDFGVKLADELFEISEPMYPN